MRTNRIIENLVVAYVVPSNQGRLGITVRNHGAASHSRRHLRGPWGLGSR